MNLIGASFTNVDDGVVDIDDVDLMVVMTPVCSSLLAQHDGVVDFYTGRAHRMPSNLSKLYMVGIRCVFNQ